MVHLEGHSAVVYRDVIYLFGGSDHITGLMLNNVWSMAIEDIHSNGPLQLIGSGDSNSVGGISSVVELRVVDTKGTIPPPRCFHSCSLRGQFMVVTGGCEVDSAATSFGPAASDQSSEDQLVLYALNLDTFVWSRYFVPSSAPNQPVPQPRCHATLTSTYTQLILFGGYPVDGDIKTLRNNHWQLFGISGEADVASIANKGSSSPMLWGHTATHCHDCLVVFGGVDLPSMSEVSSLCIYNFEEQKWRWAEFPLSPTPRSLHSAVADGVNLVIYGGFQGRPDRQESPNMGDVWAFSLSSGMWQEWECIGVAPPARSGHACVKHQGKMYVIGGLEGTNKNLSQDNTMGILDLDTRKWQTKQLHVDSSLAVPIESHHHNQHQPQNLSPHQAASSLFPAAADDEGSSGKKRAIRDDGVVTYRNLYAHNSTDVGDALSPAGLNAAAAAGVSVSAAVARTPTTAAEASAAAADNDVYAPAPRADNPSHPQHHQQHHQQQQQQQHGEFPTFPAGASASPHADASPGVVAPSHDAWSLNDLQLHGQQQEQPGQQQRSEAESHAQRQKQRHDEQQQLLAQFLGSAPPSSSSLQQQQQQSHEYALVDTTTQLKSQQSLPNSKEGVALTASATTTTRMDWFGGGGYTSRSPSEFAPQTETRESEPDAALHVDGAAVARQAQGGGAAAATTTGGAPYHLQSSPPTAPYQAATAAPSDDHMSPMMTGMNHRGRSVSGSTYTSVAADATGCSTPLHNDEHAPLHPPPIPIHRPLSPPGVGVAASTAAGMRPTSTNRNITNTNADSGASPAALAREHPTSPQHQPHPEIDGIAAAAGVAAAAAANAAAHNSEQQQVVVAGGALHAASASSSNWTTGHQQQQGRRNPFAWEEQPEDEYLGPPPPSSTAVLRSEYYNSQQHQSTAGRDMDGGVASSSSVVSTLGEGSSAARSGLVVPPLPQPRPERPTIDRLSYRSQVPHQQHDDYDHHQRHGGHGGGAGVSSGFVLGSSESSSLLPSSEARVLSSPADGTKSMELQDDENQAQQLQSPPSAMLQVGGGGHVHRRGGDIIDGSNAAMANPSLAATRGSVAAGVEHTGATDAFLRRRSLFPSSLGA